MPSIEDLKKLNSPMETLNQPYMPLICAIPKEQWEAMLRLMTGMARTLPELTNSVSRLPTAQNLEQMMRDFHQNIYREQINALSSRILEIGRRNENSLDTTFQALTEVLVPKITATVKKLESTLQHRDMWEPKLKAKWFGLGSLCSVILFLLLRLLKIW